MALPYRINYGGVTYQLSATGSKTKAGDDWYAVKHYQIFVSVVKEGREVKQLLAEADDFNDNMIHFSWAGDLDEDKQLDFIIDLSRHYNQELLTLFLSSEASINEVMKKVAELSIGWLLKGVGRKEAGYSLPSATNSNSTS